MKRYLLLALLGVALCIPMACNNIMFAVLEKKTIFRISEDQKAIVLDGTINSAAFDKFKALATQYPTVKKIEIVNCDGSINDIVNLQLAQYVHEQGFSIHLKDNGLIASGGTDFFLAGVSRTVGTNTKVGVHSWAGDGKVATDFPKGHKLHQKYIDYYVAVGFTPQMAEDFYFFTINAAPADEIHWMTEAELKRYNFLTF